MRFSFEKIKTNILLHSSKLIKVLAISFLLFSLFNFTNVHAATSPDCKTQLKEGIPTLQNIFILRNFYPVIPDACHSDESNKPPRLTNAVFVAFRAYGFLTAIGIYFFTVMMIVRGVQWMIGAFEGEEGIARAKKSLQKSLIAVVILILAPTLVIQIANLLFDFDETVKEFENIEYSD